MTPAQKYHAQANRHIAELVVQIAHQRAIVKHALETGQGSEMAESLLDAFPMQNQYRLQLFGCRNRLER
jgi:hypothetical protein